MSIHNLENGPFLRLDKNNRAYDGHAYLVHPKGKFWAIRFSQHKCWVQFGANGTTGQVRDLHQNPGTNAYPNFDDRIQAKKKKGYRFASPLAVDNGNNPGIFSYSQTVQLMSSPLVYRVFNSDMTLEREAFRNAARSLNTVAERSNTFRLQVIAKQNSDKEEQIEVRSRHHDEANVTRLVYRTDEKQLYGGLKATHVETQDYLHALHLEILFHLIAEESNQKYQVLNEADHPIGGMYRKPRFLLSLNDNHPACEEYERYVPLLADYLDVVANVPVVKNDMQADYINW